MNTLTLIITITLAYLAGCILAYPRAMASFNELDEQTIYLKPMGRKAAIIISFFSWIGFIAGIAVYFIRNDKHFFQWKSKFSIALLFFTFTFHLSPTTCSAQTVQVCNIPGRAYITGDVSPNQARTAALQDAKLNALKRAGIPENISSYQDLQTNQVQNQVDQQFNSRIQSLLTGTVVNDTITVEKTVIDTSGRVIYEVWINASVQKCLNYDSEKRANPERITVIPEIKKIPVQTFFYPNGDTYTGGRLNGQRDGYGTYTWANGAKYIGYYKQGIRTGAGVWYGYTGKVLSGYWSNGQLVQYCVFNNDKNTILARGTGVNSQRSNNGESSAEALNKAPSPQAKLINDQNQFSQEVEAEQSKMQ